MPEKLDVVEKTVPDTKQSYNPSKKIKEYERRVYDQYYRIKPGRSKYEAMWKNARKTWEMERPPRGEDDWQSNIIIPVTTSIIEAILADMIDLNLRPYIVPVGKEDKDKAEVLNHVVNFTWEKGNGDMAMYDIIKDALTLGTGIAQEYYLDDKRMVHQLNKYNPEKNIESYVTKEVSDFNDVILEPVKLDDILVDPKARGFNGPFSARYAYRRYVMHIEDFRRFFSGPIWNPFDNVKHVKPGGDTEYSSIFQRPEDIDNSKDVEVIWYWEKSPDDALIICGNGVVVYAGPNPYNHKQLPFARAVDIKRTHEFYGKGEADILSSLQDELTLLRRMRLDQTHLAIFKPFLVSERESMDENELLLRPGGAIHVNDTELGIKELAISDPSRASYMEEDRIKEDVVRVTGIDDRFQSVKKATTATEAAILKEQTLKHIRLKLWLLQRTLLKEVGRLRVANIQQFYSIPRLEKVLGDKNTEKYQELLQTLSAGGKLQMVKGEPYEKKYRDIRAEDMSVEKDLKTNELKLTKTNGFTFFEATPDMLNGNFDVQYSGSPDIPISKPLKLSKFTESLASPVVAMAIESGYYNAGKVADTLMELNDQDPDDFRMQQQQDQQDFTKNLIELARIENSKMEQGEEVDGTPYANPGHTEIHMEKLKSLDTDDEKIIQIFSDHIAVELAAQAYRMEQGINPDSQGGQGQGTPPASGQGVDQANPAMQTGGTDVVRAGQVNPPPG